VLQACLGPESIPQRIQRSKHREVLTPRRGTRPIRLDRDRDRGKPHAIRDGLRLPDNDESTRPPLVGRLRLDQLWEESFKEFHAREDPGVRVLDEHGDGSVWQAIEQFHVKTSLTTRLLQDALLELPLISNKKAALTAGQPDRRCSGLALDRTNAGCMSQRSHHRRVTFTGLTNRLGASHRSQRTSAKRPGRFRADENAMSEFRDGYTEFGYDEAIELSNRMQRGKQTATRLSLHGRPSDPLHVAGLLLDTTAEDTPCKKEAQERNMLLVLGTISLLGEVTDGQEREGLPQQCAASQGIDQ
jgi:hypothetical protein